MKLLLIIIVLLLCIGAISACIPLPIIHVDHRTGKAHHTQNVIEQLVDESASRERVVEMLGIPVTYQKEFLSYIACGKPGAVDFYVIGGTEVGRNSPPPYNCFEFVIAFDNHDRVTSYSKTITSGIVAPELEEERARKLGKFADQGDILAKKLLEQTLVYRLEHEDPLAQYQMYYRESARVRRLEWLCRAADSGYAPAQAEVGRIYMLGLFGIEQNYQKAYQWYWRANKKNPGGWKYELNDARHMATNVQPLSYLPPGQCERELLSDI